jgi:hypothetical protein
LPKTTKNLAWASKNFQTVTHLATEILNISTAKSVAELEEFMLGYYQISP